MTSICLLRFNLSFNDDFKTIETNAYLSILSKNWSELIIEIWDRCYNFFVSPPIVADFDSKHCYFMPKN
jgi:hypothetical protein